MLGRMADALKFSLLRASRSAVVVYAEELGPVALPEVAGR